MLEQKISSSSVSWTYIRARDLRPTRTRGTHDLADPEQARIPLECVDDTQRGQCPDGRRLLRRGTVIRVLHQRRKQERSTAEQPTRLADPRGGFVNSVTPLAGTSCFGWRRAQ